MSDKGLSSYLQYLSGDEVGLEALVRTYSDALIRYAYCYVQDAAAAEDIMEDTIVTLIMKRKRMDSGDKLHGYLYKIARNRSIDYLRKHRRMIPLEDVQNTLTAGDLETEHFRRARNETVYICMQSLPEQYREILHLCYFEGFSLPEAAQILSRSMKQIYNLHTRAKGALKDLLIKEGICHEEL
ncbi:MAG: sigma-70 family RNA polymerase sigma factor [Ruminococcaceae bacterium]|nr:sigma-70 family RNA polymerase sigma factor [Oscillospiraceae bacterium]